MTRVFASALVLALLTAMAAAPASAAGLHFVRATAAGPDGAGNLVVGFKLAGGGGAATVDVTATADATYDCGGTLVGPSTVANGTAFASRGGQVAGSLTLVATPPCAPDQFRAVSYANVRLGATGADGTTVPGTFARTF